MSTLFWDIFSIKKRLVVDLRDKPIYNGIMKGVIYMSKERELTSIRIRRKMDELNLSYRELSDLTGINKSSLQRYVTNVTSKIPMDNARLIAKAFKVDLSWLIGMDEKQKSIQLRL